jgi:hypothetical protein
MKLNYTVLLNVAHYALALLALGLAGLAEAGISMPGVTVDPKLAGTVGLAVLISALKGRLPQNVAK